MIEQRQCIQTLEVPGDVEAVVRRVLSCRPEVQSDECDDVRREVDYRDQPPWLVATFTSSAYAAS